MEHICILATAGKAIPRKNCCSMAYNVAYGTYCNTQQYSSAYKPLLESNATQELLQYNISCGMVWQCNAGWWIYCHRLYILYIYIQYNIYNLQYIQSAYSWEVGGTMRGCGGDAVWSICHFHPAYFSLLACAFYSRKYFSFYFSISLPPACVFRSRTNLAWAFYL